MGCHAIKDTGLNFIKPQWKSRALLIFTAPHLIWEKLFELIFRCILWKFFIFSTLTLSNKSIRLWVSSDVNSSLVDRVISWLSLIISLHRGSIPGSLADSEINLCSFASTRFILCVSRRRVERRTDSLRGNCSANWATSPLLLVFPSIFYF